MGWWSVKNRKRKRALYNFKEKEAVERTGEKYLLWWELVQDHCVRAGL